MNGSGFAADFLQSVHIGALTTPYLNWPLDRALDGIASAGFRYFGLRPGHPDGQHLPAAPRPEDFRQLERRIERRGLTLSLVFSPDSARDPRGALVQDIENVARLNCELLLIFAPSPSPRFAERRIDEMAWFTEVASWFDAMSVPIRRAEELGVTLVLKPHGGVAGTGRDLAAIIDRLGSTAVRVCYDAGNIAYYEGVAPEVDLETVATLVRGVCIKDHRGGQGVVDFPVPGEGEIDHRALFRILERTGFEGPCLVERIDGLRTPEDVDSALTKSRLFLESILG